jgi:hypothetical protein
MRHLPRHLHFRASLSNKAQQYALTVASLAPLVTWVKGHQEDSNDTRERMNVVADRLSKTPTTYSIHQSDLQTRCPGMYLHQERIVGPLTDPTHDLSELHAQWALVTPLQCINLNLVAFYYNKSSSSLLLETPVIEDLLAIRHRTLFPRRGPRRTCSCGTRIVNDIHHVLLHCTHPAHTVTPTSFHNTLQQRYGNGWWAPSCLEHALCTCDPTTYNCAHRFRALAPKYKYETHPLSDWARYLHARLNICHPSNGR